jgi:hypothetical protein
MFNDTQKKVQSKIKNNTTDWKTPYKKLKYSIFKKTGLQNTTEIICHNDCDWAHRRQKKQICTIMKLVGNLL